ncbi:MAG: hypothetical protein FWG23_07280 [Eggerthellaceae bacterium]|jgi:hypothetical protein|nr:hypothetical protein [Eggerthellaceae bacterium]MDR2715302.1 hypothetical protein [Coriobacteriaceae bacterium]
MSEQGTRSVDPRKRKRVVILSIVLVALVALGATLAYLSAITNERTNVFSFAPNITGSLEEPSWDPEKGQDLTPGREVPKDPYIVNTSEADVDEYVAIRVIFTDGVGNPLSDDPTDPDWAGRLLRLIDIDWNYDDWELLEASATDETDSVELVWVFKGIPQPPSDPVKDNGVVAQGEQTSPLFTRVIIRENFTADELAATSGLNWDTEYAWLAGFSSQHTADCYEPGDCTCTPTYNHHSSCAIAGDPDAATTPQGGSIGSLTCDCTPAEVHQSGCKANILSLIEDCGHDPEGINGFQIILRGAVVQAGVDGMDTWDAPATGEALLALFEANPYEPEPPVAP